MLLLLLFSLSPSLYASRDSSFISTHFFVVNLDGPLVLSSNKFIIFYIPLLYYIIILILDYQIISDY